ncbi:MAG: hypothetical protein A3F43_04845 [Gammaproteobacteria bacterium RIFCSPHIGHO2_12_FULL_42_10]|nr:MAG: hypothetical protein A3F43_04845 [Gammaproteobacteria bacterium RIFCSPHIGHO2_12_FULL_42_10]
MQLLRGIFGLGRFARYIPLPVVAGFTAGIGAIIIIDQLPRAFGLEPPPESHVFSVIQHIMEYMHEINYVSLSLVLFTLVVIHALKKWAPRIPAILPAVVLTAAIVYFFKLDHTSQVALIEPLPSTLPTPAFPKFSAIPLDELLWNAFTVYLLASVETLLSSAAFEKLTNAAKHDPNQELIGQGLGNIAVSIFGGIPVTSVIARSMINARAGAKTRRASIIHSLIILLAVLAISPLINLIPIAALAAVCFSIAFSMLNYREFYWLWLTSRSEAGIYAITFLAIVFVDLLAGIQVGIVAAGLWVLFTAAKTQFHISSSTHDNIIRMSLTGSLTFLSNNEIADLEARLSSATQNEIVIIDLSRVSNLDSSGASALIDLTKSCHARSVPCYIKGLARRFEPLFHTPAGQDILNKYYIVSESELREKHEAIVPISSRGRLIHGVQHFYAERKHDDKRLFEFLAKNQDPHTLFITCSDSRIIPSHMTSSDPGDLFIIRNVGNYIPPFAQDMTFSEAAAIEFALTQLQITDIVVCGHANCGAIRACLNEEPSLQTELNQWIARIRSSLDLTNEKEVNQLAMENVVNQVEHLKLYPVVQTKLAQGALTIHAWFYHIDHGIMYEWNESTKRFESIIDLE